MRGDCLPREKRACRSVSLSRTMTSGGNDLAIHCFSCHPERERGTWMGGRLDACAAHPTRFLATLGMTHGLLLHSTNVTLLISRKVVVPSDTLLSADSRRKIIPSSFAAFLISDAGRRSRIIVRMRSERSSSSEIAARPWKPVPLHSRHPDPSKNVLPR